MLQRFSDMGTGVIENKEMLIVVTAFAITAILVYAIRRMSINYSRAIAVLVGTLADIVILLIGDLMYDANFSLAGVILGSIVCALIALVMQFFQFNLDYARTEKVQFEDDEYYYYVKAIPKVSVSTPEKTVKRINERQETEIIDTEAVRKNAERKREKPVSKRTPKKGPGVKVQDMREVDKMLLTQSLRKDLNLDD